MSRKSELMAGIHGPDGSVQLDLEPVTAHVVAQYHNANGGSSFAVHGGERARDGWAVGGLEGTPESSVDSARISPEDYQSHRDKVRTSVKHPDAIAGTWVESGKSVMDASQAVLDRSTAKHLQIHRNQRAVFNLKTGKEENLR